MGTHISLGSRYDVLSERLRWPPKRTAMVEVHDGSRYPANRPTLGLTSKLWDTYVEP